MQNKPFFVIYKIGTTGFWTGDLLSYSVLQLPWWRDETRKFSNYFDIQLNLPDEVTRRTENVLVGREALNILGLFCWRYLWCRRPRKILTNLKKLKSDTTIVFRLLHSLVSRFFLLTSFNSRKHRYCT